MATMNKEIYAALIEAGVSEAKASAAAEAVTHSQDAATRTDLAQLEVRLTRLMLYQGAAIVTLVVTLVKLL